MQLTGRYALLVHVRAIYMVVDIGLNFVKFNVSTVYSVEKNVNKHLCERQISDHLDLDLHQQACIQLQRLTADQ